MGLLWSLALSMQFLLLSSLLSSMLTNCLPSVHHPSHECHEDESYALLHFKESFVVSKYASYITSGYSKTASWMVGTDGCSWDGIECDEVTGHVIGIDLSSSQLYGSMDANSTLFSLVHLQRLDLSDNHFNHSQIPPRIGDLSELIYLNLSQTAETTFSGEIPPEVSKLSNLLSLDLRSYTTVSNPPDPINQLQLNLSTLISLIQNATRLEEINLDFVTISSSIPDMLTNLTYLQELSLKSCGMYGEFPLEKFLKLKMLNFLALSRNRLTLLGEKSPSNVTLPPLQVLELAWCNLSGEIPSWIMNLTYLGYLDLQYNNIQGEISESLFRLDHLEYLSLTHNLLQGQLELDMFLKLKKLSSLFLDYNKLSLFTAKSSSNVTLPPIKNLGLGICNLSGEIPSWILNLTTLSYLSLQENNLQGRIPQSLFQLENLDTLSLHSNLLEGQLELDLFLKLNKLSFLSLSYNKLSLLSGKGSSNATLPPLQLLGLSGCNLFEVPMCIRDMDGLGSLRMSHNDIGSLPNWLWRKRNLQALEISSSSLIGEISPLICNMKLLGSLDLSNNKLSGTIPSCLGSFSQYLQTLSLQGNKLLGLIPQTYIRGSALKMIDFSNNYLQGLFPRALVNCEMLEYLDMSHNQINDSFPFWMGSLPELKAIALRYNKFHGAIKCLSRCTFPKLHIIDLSHNEFSGSLPPEIIKNWKSFTNSDARQLQYMDTVVHYKGKSWFSNTRYSFAMSNKGVVMNYKVLQSDFYALIAIDLSSNKISGEIPEIMGDLKSLVLLNLSNNMFTGNIPYSLGKLSNLETLDLSVNSLSGKIPQELTRLTFLEFFNVSFNKLSGPIPESNQFSTFQQSFFEGNQGLCGIQLLKKCEDNARPPPLASDGDDEFDSGSFFEFDWKIILIGYGGGLVAGLALGSAFSSEIFGWLKKVFKSQKPRLWT